MADAVYQSTPFPLWEGIKGGGESQAQRPACTPTLTTSPQGGGKPARCPPDIQL